MFFAFHPLGLFGLFWLIPFFGYLLFAAIPIAEIAHKAGYSRAWALIGLVPFLGVVFLWVFAFSRWPAQGGRV